MHWMEIRVAFESEDEGKNEIITALVADLFYDLGAKGVVVDDPFLVPTEGWADDLPRAVQPALTGYLPKDDRLDASLQSLVESLAGLARTHGFTHHLTTKAIAEEDWAESWKAFFYPEKITPRLVVKPTWREYQTQANELILEIDPGMAFGTGTHPTTSLCLQLLEQIIRPGDRVLDVGTGSGILLVAAAKLGAGTLTGVDSDPVALDVARINLRRNGIADSNFELYCGHLVDPIKQAYDVVLANILADVVIDLLADVGRVMTPGGILICSGIIESRRQAVMEKMAACRLALTQSVQKDEWVALCGEMAHSGRDSK